MISFLITCTLQIKIACKVTKRKGISTPLPYYISMKTLSFTFFFAFLAIHQGVFHSFSKRHISEMKEDARQDASSPQLIFLAYTCQARIRGVTIGALIEEIESGDANFHPTLEAIRTGDIGKK